MAERKTKLERYFLLSPDGSFSLLRQPAPEYSWFRLDVALSQAIRLLRIAVMDQTPAAIMVLDGKDPTQPQVMFRLDFGSGPKPEEPGLWYASDEDARIEFQAVGRNPDEARETLLNEMEEGEYPLPVTQLARTLPLYPVGQSSVRYEEEALPLCGNCGDYLDPTKLDSYPVDPNNPDGSKYCNGHCLNKEMKRAYGSNWDGGEDEDHDNQ